MQRTFCRYFLLLQVFLGRYCYGQNNSTDTLFEQFRKDILIELEEHQGGVVWDDDTRETYYLLLATHPTDVLIKYTEDSIPAVRSQIFAGLVQKNAGEKTLSEILNRHLGDTAKFTLSPTDVVITWSVREYMQTFLNSKTDIKLPEVDFKARLEKIRRDRYTVIAGARHGIIAKDSLLQVDSLTCSLKWAKITSFTITTRGKIMTSGNVLTGRMKRNIKKLKSGDQIYFENIKAEGPDKITRQLAPISLKIK
jgi:hypothetical protein